MKKFFAILILVLIVGFGLSNESSLKEFNSYFADVFETDNSERDLVSGSGEIFSVERIVDGDTIYLSNGEKVRLLGLNSPEKGFCYYLEATEFLRNLIGDSEISLKSDKTNQDKDRYGRLLRYIYVNGEMLNIKIVQEGYAKYMENYPIIYSSEFAEAENQAREAGKGLWGECENIVK